MDIQTCPHCGASNAAAVRWCNRCFAVLDDAPGPAAAAQPGHMAATPVTAREPSPTVPGWAQRSTPPPWSAPIPSEFRSQNEGYAVGAEEWRPPVWGQTSVPVRRKKSQWPLVIGAVTMMAAAVITFLVLKKDGAVALPPSVGGHARIESEEVRVLERMARSYAEEHGVGDAAIGLYGDGNEPVMALVAFRGLPTDVDQDDFMRDLRSGLSASASSQGISAGQPFQRDGRGVTLTCVDVSAGQQGTMCAWAKNGTAGLLVGFPALSQDDVILLSAEAAQALR